MNVKDTNNFTHTKLKSGVYYKYQVKAYQFVEGKKEILAASKLIHVTTTGSKKGNPVKVTADPSVLDLKKNEKSKLNAKMVQDFL